MLTKWEDATSYSRDKPRVATTWSLRLTDGFRVVVTCGYLRMEGKWLMHCEPWFNAYEMRDVTSREEAQKRAIALVRERVNKLHAALVHADPHAQQ